MPSPYCERAIEEALHHGKAILKFISPNDVGLTGGHQYGYYLPKKKSVWPLFTPHPPQRGMNSESEVAVTWQDGRVTNSRVKWYGAAKDEYRLTGFGKDFPFRTFDNVGDLLVLIPTSYSEFSAYVLDLEEDIEEIQSALGVEIIRTWAAYHAGVSQVETEDECLDRRFRRFAKALTEFPRGAVFSEEALLALRGCVKRLGALSADDILLRSMDAEYHLFRLVERQLCQPEIVRVFRDVDDFLQTASSITNRRKSRAGRSLENHVEHLLREAHVPHEMRPGIDGRPDIVIPSREAYRDPSYPVEKLFIVGVKTTCKDRWRQVLNEGKRVPQKHILTMQPGISGNQLNEMHDADVTLIVPQKLHKEYPPKHRITLLSLEQFIASVRATLADL
jgi:type II restriction enzyme